MTALPIEPTDKEVRDFIVLESETGTGALPKLVRAAHQAGVDAERARAAAEATEEWGVRIDDGGGARNEPLLRQGERHARDTVREAAEDGVAFEAVRRTAAGPWEVQS